jgi:hypothetical protein
MPTEDDRRGVGHERPRRPLCRLRVLPGNPLSAQIRFQVEPNGYGERILPHSVVEYFTKNADGTLSLLTEGSTQPVSSRVTHAGIARVAKFFFLID